jgi:hypothetical protein
VRLRFLAHNLLQNHWNGGQPGSAAPLEKSGSWCSASYLLLRLIGDCDVDEKINQNRNANSCVDDCFGVLLIKWQTATIILQ